jgi:hypothetical protein
MVKTKNTGRANTEFNRIKRLFLLKLRNIDKMKLFDFIMDNKRWVKIEIN